MGEDRLHCSFPTQPKEGHIRYDTKHGTNTIVSVHASQLISAEIYQHLPLSRTIPNTPMEVLLDLGRDHVGFPTYSRDKRHRGEPGHTRDRHKNLTNQPQNQPHPPTHAPDHTRTLGHTRRPTPHHSPASAVVVTAKLPRYVVRTVRESLVRVPGTYRTPPVPHPVHPPPLIDERYLPRAPPHILDP